MKIRNELGLSFDDVLLVPRRSAFQSRFSGEIDLSTQFLPNIRLKYPIVASNMDTIAGPAMINAMGFLGGLGIAHRFMSVEQHVDVLNKIEPTLPRVACIGIGQRGLDRLKALVEAGATAVLIDVAHGHSDGVITQIQKVKEIYPNLSIIAGSVATYEGTRDLAAAGADCIKVGVGCGCLASGTRVLMDNGTYKNIEEIKIHDKVINKDGKAVEVVAVRFSGYKPVYKYRNNSFYKSTHVTGDHRHWVGDYSSSINSYQQGNLSKILDKRSKTIPKKSKYKWKRTDELNNCTMLLPKDISFNMPETFMIDLQDFALANRNWKGMIERKPIIPSYELGYVLGCFLGDGTASIYNSKRTLKNGNISKNASGSLKWYFGSHEASIAKKLSKCLNEVFGHFSNTKIEKTANMTLVINRSNVVVRFFQQFGKKYNKNLPDKYLCSDKKYLLGLLNGLVDSDGSSPEKGGADYRTCFGNTSPYLVELYMIAHKIVHGYFPSIQIRSPTAGGLKNCNVENCRETYLARNVGHPEWLMTNSYQINRVYTEIENTKLVLPTYDIEVNCPTHSFIANNAIVHNSLCSTRITTGCGVPQLTALIDAKRAIDDYKVFGRNVTIMCDGGVKNGGDITKALAAGADAIMTGGLLAGTEEAPGELISIDGSPFKVYRGMSSRAAQEDWKGMATSIEGEITHVPYKGAVGNIVNELTNNVLSGMSYQNAKNINELQEVAKFIRMTGAGLAESKPHGKY